MDIEQSAIGLLIFHCEYNKLIGSITHNLHDFEVDLYYSLPNLYAVCIAITDNNQKEVRAGFFIKTNLNHNQSEFLNNLELAVKGTPGLKKYYSSNMSFLPAKIGIEGAPPTEAEMLKIMTKQYSKFSIAGNC